MHKVLGTVASMRAISVEVKTTDGKVVTVMLNAKTVYHARQGQSSIRRR